jgi:hypothetical protein
MYLETAALVSRHFRGTNPDTYTKVADVCREHLWRLVAVTGATAPLPKSTAPIIYIIYIYIYISPIPGGGRRVRVAGVNRRELESTCWLLRSALAAAAGCFKALLSLLALLVHKYLWIGANSSPLAHFHAPLLLPLLAVSRLYWYKKKACFTSANARFARHELESTCWLSRSTRSAATGCRAAVK